MARTLPFIQLVAFHISLFCLLSFVISSSGAKTTCSCGPSSCPLMPSGHKESSFEIKFGCNFGTELSRAPYLGLSVVWAFPIVEWTPRDLPWKRGWVGGYFGCNFKEQFEPESSNMKVQGGSCSTPPGPVIHGLSYAKSNCKFPHLPSGGKMEHFGNTRVTPKSSQDFSLLLVTCLAHLNVFFLYELFDIREMFQFYYEPFYP